MLRTEIMKWYSVWLRACVRIIEVMYTTGGNVILMCSKLTSTSVNIVSITDQRPQVQLSPQEASLYRQVMQANSETEAPELAG